MRLIIEREWNLRSLTCKPEPRRLAVLDRMDDDLEQLGLTLEEGRELLAAAQSALVSSQAEQWLDTEDYCRRCRTPLYHKDSRSVGCARSLGKSGYKVRDSGPVLVIDRVARADTPSAH
jgi:hypothetical protein